MNKLAGASKKEHKKKKVFLSRICDIKLLLFLTLVGVSGILIEVSDRSETFRPGEVQEAILNV